MRILHVLSERGFSGGEHQLGYLLGHLKAQGHESVVVLNPRARFATMCADLGLDVHRVRMRNDADLIAVARLRRLFRQLQPDLIHLACSRGHKLGAHAALWMRNRPPLVATRRMDYPLGKSRYRRWLYGRAVDAVVAVSQGVRREVLAVGVPPERVHCIHDGVDEQRLAPLRKSTRRAAMRAELGVRDEVVGLTSASLHRRKGHDVLLQALSALDLSEGRARHGGVGSSGLLWIIAGDGPERSTLEAQAASLGLLEGNVARDAARPVRVRFVGDVRPVDSLLAASDVFCLPSRKEGLGVALLEAMAAGLAVVGSRVGGIVEAIGGNGNGILVDVEDSVGLTLALESLCLDTERRERLGVGAAQRVRDNFTIRAMCEKTEALYTEIVAAAESRSQ